MSREEADTEEQHDGIPARVRKLLVQNAINWGGLLAVYVLAVIAGGWTIEHYSQELGLTVLLGTMLLYILFSPPLTIDGNKIGAWPTGAGLRAARRCWNFAARAQNEE